ncbi:transketolase [Sulfuriroseicoccus oceanibius]|uniref:Transketolase n=1 Tax=Sulfuriroseicoccus oceanibius TaxID=2707525 RepID=A0A6B3L354_9BACT|nr:transketolase [Sulfuriroseicoccus oceanibius]QQL45520.1 transketolase [Sulfuriroseicoccus oceanibius]
MNTDILSTAANQARGLAIDAVHACSSGHLGLPLGCAEIGAVLFGEALQFDPSAPKWVNRDRFVLSAGHGSMFLYSWLHLAGYDLPLDEVKAFRQLGSKTPGHPENFETVGVEATTGPLGQGVGNAVGYALSGKMAAATYNTADHTILDYHVVALAGDGCLQEGVAREAVAFAGHNKLDNLILIYDSNDVTLDAMADVTQSEDTAAQYESMGWDVQTVDGHDMVAFAKAFQAAKDNNNGKPKLIIAKTEIGRGISQVAGTAKAHGEGGANFADEAHAALGLPAGETFYVSQDVRDFFAKRAEERAAQFAEWEKTFDAWTEANEELACQFGDALAGAVPSDILEQIPEFGEDYNGATRAAGGDVIQAVAKAVPHFITGSADLYGSTKNYIKDGGDYSDGNPTGRNIWYGIREHAMGAIMNGIAYDGIWRTSGATFAVFADYLRPSIRIAALAKLPVVYIFTHDSVGVGEDGPTHQPVETCSGLRVIPNLDVIRPGDPEETAGAYAAAMLRTDGPTLLLLSRQNVKTQSQIPAKDRRVGAEKGGYIARKESAALETILIATGSELDLAMQAAEQLGAGTRVVSMPCMERFDRQSAEYRESVLPAACTKRVAVEAGVSGLWWKYVGTAGQVVGIDRFGISAPGNTVFSELGMTVDNIVETAKSLG